MVSLFLPISCLLLNIKDWQDCRSARLIETRLPKEYCDYRLRGRMSWRATTRSANRATAASARTHRAPLPIKEGKDCFIFFTIFTTYQLYMNVTMIQFLSISYWVGDIVYFIYIIIWSTIWYDLITSAFVW